MPKLALYNQSGSQVGDIELNDAVFGIEPNTHVLHDAVVMQQASKRQGTHAVKNRSAVSGGGRKPWRQKGTGRARQGSIRSPQWVGGGVVFGPTPRSYRVKVNQKVRNLALRSALSHHASEGSLIVVDKIEFAAPKTKDFTQTLEALKVNKKVLVVDTKLEQNLVLSSRNINTVQVGLANHVSVYDILNAHQLLLTVEAVKYFEEALQ